MHFFSGVVISRKYVDQELPSEYIHKHFCLRSAVFDNILSQLITHSSPRIVQPGNEFYCFGMIRTCQGQGR